MSDTEEPKIRYICTDNKILNTMSEANEHQKILNFAMKHQKEISLAMKEEYSEGLLSPYDVSCFIAKNINLIKHIVGDFK